MLSSMKARISAGALAVALLLCVGMFCSTFSAYAAENNSGSKLATGQVQAQTTALTAAGWTACSTQSVVHNEDAYKGKTVANGYYIMAAGTDMSKLIGVQNKSKKNGARVITQTENNKSQIWKFTYDNSAKAYIITNKLTKKALTVKGKAAGSQVYQAKKSSKRDKKQRWIVKSTAYGYQIISMANKKVCLSVAGAASQEIANVDTMRIATSDPASNVWICPVAKWSYGNVLKNGYYTISQSDSASGTPLFLGAVGGMIGKGVRMCLSAAGEHEQVFEITHVRGGYYKIENLNSSLALTATGSKITQQSFAGSANLAQLWMPVITEKGVRLVNGNGIALDVNGGAATGGMQAVGAAPSDESVTQNWTISPTTTGMSGPCRRGLLKANARGSKTNFFISVDMTNFELNIFKRDDDDSAWEPFKQWSVATGMRKNTTQHDGILWMKALYHGDDHGYRAWYWNWIGAGGALHSTICAAGTKTITDGRTWGYITGFCIRSKMSNAKFIYDKIPTGTYVSRFY